jgi:hypothetical protein
MKTMIRSLIVGLLTALVPMSSRAEASNGKPKLVVLLVFDQFRGDYLDRYRSEFKAPNGWNLFLNKGAHFTDCYYDYANLVTAAGMRRSARERTRTATVSPPTSGGKPVRTA